MAMGLIGAFAGLKNRWKALDQLGAVILLQSLTALSGIALDAPAIH